MSLFEILEIIWGVIGISLVILMPFFLPQLIELAKVIFIDIKYIYENGYEEYDENGDYIHK